MFMGERIGEERGKEGGRSFREEKEVGEEGRRRRGLGAKMPTSARWSQHHSWTHNKEPRKALQKRLEAPKGTSRGVLKSSVFSATQRLGANAGTRYIY